MTASYNPNSGGFTVIEVMIVIGIVGLMFGIIFGAIPAVERSGRNNERKQDVAKILYAVSKYAINNGGNFPTADPAAVDVTSPTYVLKSAKLTFYDPKDPTNIIFTSSSTGRLSAPPKGPHIDTNTVEVANYQKCDPSNHGSTNVAADYRDIVVLYATEAKNAAAPQCLQL